MTRSRWSPVTVPRVTRRRSRSIESFPRPQSSHVPYSWVEQTRPGGLVITPWGTSYYNGDLLALTVTEQHTAVGTFVDKASFMTLRQ